MNFTKLAFGILLLASSLLLSACKEESTSSATSYSTDSGVTTTTTTTTLPTEVKRIVSYGAGLNFNAQTGSWSEMSFVQRTVGSTSYKFPTTVYYDRSSTASTVSGVLKYAAMDSAGRWNIEVIDANSQVTAATNTCGGGATTARCIGAPNVAVPTASQAQIFDIKHLSDGTAIVVYPYGGGGAAATIGKEVRAAVRNATTGIWSVSTIVSSADLVSLIGGATTVQIATLEYPIKGVRLLVDDSDRIHLLFSVYATVQASSATVYMMRSAAGSWTTPAKIPVTTTPAAYNAVTGATAYAAGSSVNKAGASWCKYNSGGSSADASGIIYATSVTSAAVNRPFLLKCASTNADGSCATWSGYDLATACAGICLTTTPAFSAAVNSAQISDIAVDPVTGKILFAMFAPYVTAPAAATVTAIQGGTNRCDNLPAGNTLTAMTTRVFPTAAQGTLGLRVATDGTNAYLATLTAATATSLILNYTDSNLTAAWTTANQVTVEATTNTITGGFLLDTTSTPTTIWGSYGALTAAAAGVLGQDIKVFNTVPAEINSTTGYVNVENIDQTNIIFQSPAVPALASEIAPNGTVGYIYFYQEPGTSGPNSRLYYGFRGGTGLAPIFAEKVISNSINGATTFMNGLHPSLDYDTDSNPAVAFLDQGVAASSGYLTIARSSNGGVRWDLERADGGNVTTNNLGQYTSIRAYRGTSSSNIIKNTLGVSYYEFSTGANAQRLKFAVRAPNGTWRRSIVEGTGATGTGCSTTASVGTGLYSKLRWTSDGNPVILYQSNATGVKKLRAAVGAFSSGTFTWTCYNLDTNLQGSNTRGEGIDFELSSSDIPYIVHHETGVSTNAVRFGYCSSAVATCLANSSFTFEEVAQVGTVTGISSNANVRLNSQGIIHISYYSASSQKLLVAKKSSLSSTSWTTDTIEEPVSGVYYNSQAGQFAVMNINSSGYPLIFYRSLENWLKYYSKESN